MSLKSADTIILEADIPEAKVPEATFFKVAYGTEGPAVDSAFEKAGKAVEAALRMTHGQFGEGQMLRGIETRVNQEDGMIEVVLIGRNSTYPQKDLQGEANQIAVTLRAINNNS